MANTASNTVTALSPLRASVEALCSLFFHVIINDPQWNINRNTLCVHIISLGLHPRTPALDYSLGQCLRFLCYFGPLQLWIMLPMPDIPLLVLVSLDLPPTWDLIAMPGSGHFLPCHLDKNPMLINDWITSCCFIIFTIGVFGKGRLIRYMLLFCFWVNEACPLSGWAFDQPELLN